MVSKDVLIGREVRTEEIGREMRSVAKWCGREENGDSYFLS